MTFEEKQENIEKKSPKISSILLHLARIVYEKRLHRSIASMWKLKPSEYIHQHNQKMCVRVKISIR